MRVGAHLLTPIGNCPFACGQDNLCTGKGIRMVRERVANRKASFLGMRARSVVTVCGENLHRQMKPRRRFVTIFGELALERSSRTCTVVMALPIAICHSLARHMDAEASTATPVGESTMSA